MGLKTEIKNLISGEANDSPKIRELYSHDASLFELQPDVVVFPKDTQDVKAVVRYVSSHKDENPELSITPRSAGTDMSGGAINESIILDMNKHFTAIKKVTATTAHTQPGVFYRDFEAETLKHKALLPCYPASRALCTVCLLYTSPSPRDS